jgi:hypothetical protein
MKAYEEVKFSPQSFLTFPLDIVDDQLHARVTLSPPVYSYIEQGNVWTPGPIWTLCTIDKSLAAFGIRTTINRAFIL